MARQASLPAERPEPMARVAVLATIAVIVFLAWLPLQTPVAIAVFQYGHSATAAKALLVAKDVAAVGLIVALFAVSWRRLRFGWLDGMAVLYAAFVAIYSIVPWLLGSTQPLLSVASAARGFLVPVELYALGRLAVAAGADSGTIAKAFLGIAGVTAAWTLFEYLVLPVTFWSSTLDIVTFVREVQGLDYSTSLANISILGQYGIGDVGTFPRAIGAFTHPVGTATYFVMPLALATAAAFRYARLDRPWVLLGLTALSVGFALSVIVTISRGGWMAGVVAVLLAGLFYRRLVPAAVAVAIVAIFLVVVPPFSYSVLSAASGTDSSTIGHAHVTQHSWEVVVRHPLGLGVGSSGTFAEAYGGEANGGSDAVGVGENMFLTLLISVGPIGTTAFLAWLAGLFVHLLPFRRGRDHSWLLTGSGVALVGYLLTAVLSAPLLNFTTSASVWLVIGVAVGMVAAQPSGVVPLRELGRILVKPTRGKRSSESAS